MAMEAEVAALRVAAADAWAQVDSLERRCKEAMEGEASARREVQRGLDKVARLEERLGEVGRRHDAKEERLVASLDALVEEVRGAAGQPSAIGEAQDALARRVAASELEASRADGALDATRFERNGLRVELKEALEELERVKRLLDEERARSKAQGEALRDELSTALLEGRQMAKRLEREQAAAEAGSAGGGEGEESGAGASRAAALEAELAEALADFGREIMEKDRRLREARENGIELETKAKAMVHEVAERIASLERELEDARKEAEAAAQRAADAERVAESRWIIGSPALGRNAQVSTAPEPVASPARSVPYSPRSPASARAPGAAETPTLSPPLPMSPLAMMSDTERLEALLLAVETERNLRDEVESVRARELKTEHNMSMALEALAHETEVEVSLRNYIAELESEVVELRLGLGRITQHRFRAGTIQKVREGAAGVLGALAGFVGLALTTRHARRPGERDDGETSSDDGQ